MYHIASELSYQNFDKRKNIYLAKVLNRVKLCTLIDVSIISQDLNSFIEYIGFINLFHMKLRNFSLFIVKCTFYFHIHY